MTLLSMSLVSKSLSVQLIYPCFHCFPAQAGPVHLNRSCCYFKRCTCDQAWFHSVRCPLAVSIVFSRAFSLFLFFFSLGSRNKCETGKASRADSNPTICQDHCQSEGSSASERSCCRARARSPPVSPMRTDIIPRILFSSLFRGDFECDSEWSPTGKLPRILLSSLLPCKMHNFQVSI